MNSARQKSLSIAAMACVGLLLLDRIVLTPMAESWKQRGERIAELREQINQATPLLEREQSLRSRWEDMRRHGLPQDISVAEDVVIKAAARWANTSRIVLTGMDPKWRTRDAGCRTLECRASAEGDLQAVSRFLYALQTDPLGVRLESCDLSTLEDVLEHLSRAAGFIVVREVEVSGTVNVVSHQPVSDDEAVDLLNALLLKNGYAALRNGRMLTVLDLKQAHKRNIPVRRGSDPDEIPSRDELVTQIIPVRYADATKLVSNLSPLLDENAKLSANESSNALVLTDTQTSVHRVAEIIRALDTSISGIASVRVFPLHYADAKQLAQVVQKLFEGTGSSQAGNTGRGGTMGGRFRGRGDQQSNSSSTSSEARAAATRVVAMAEERTNTLLVTAGRETMFEIAELVGRLDASSAKKERVHVYPLDHANVESVAAVLRSMFEGDTSATRGTSQAENRLTTRAAEGASPDTSDTLGNRRSSR